MSAADIAELSGYLIAAWAIGFSAGWSLTLYSRAIDRST